MILRRLCLCLVLLSLPIVPGHSEETAISLPAGNAYEISPGATGVRVPLPGNLNITEPSLVDVALGTERSPELSAKFGKPAIDSAKALLIGIDAPALRQGAYDLKLQVKLGGKAQFLNLRITRPAAQLRTPDTLVIQRFVGPWGRIEKPLLPLTETSGKSGLADLHVEQIENLSGVSGQHGPILRFKEPIRGIKAGRSGWADYDFLKEDGLPWGSVQGHLQVTSPQLAAPVPVIFEVRSRRTLWWVWFFAGVGLLCGLGLRTLLPRQIDRDQALLQVADAIVEVDREKRRQDPQFQTALEGIREKLQTAFNTEKDTKKLGDVVTAAQKDLSDALAALQLRLDSALKDTEALNNLITAHWFLPADIEAARVQTKPDLDTARQALLQSNAAAAQAAVSGARGRLAGLPLLLRDWPLRLDDLLQTLGSTGLPAPASLQAGLRDSATYLRGLLVAIPDAGLQAAFDSLTQTLGAIHNARFAARKLLLELRSGIKGVASDVDLALRPVLAPAEDPLKDLRQEEPERLETLAAAAENPETSTSVVQETFLWLDRRLREALVTLLPRLSADGQKTVREKLDQRAYGDAAVEIARQIRESQAKAQAVAPTPGATQTALGKGIPGAVKPGVETPRGPLWAGIIGLRFERAERETLHLPLDLSPEGLAATRARIVQEIGTVTTLRTGLTWIGLLWLAFLLFHDKTGSLQDMAEVFFWGFGTDVTVDAFWNAAKGYKKT